MKRLYLWARVGAGSWAAVQPGALCFLSKGEAEPVAARYRALYPRLAFVVDDAPPVGTELEEPDAVA